MPFLPTSKKGLGCKFEDESKCKTYGFERLGVSTHGASLPQTFLALEECIPVVRGERVILDQRSTSSCVSHAFLAGVHIEEQRLGLPYLPSAVLYPYYHSRRHHQRFPTDSGTYLGHLASALRKFGCPPADAWPFSTFTPKVNKRPSWESMLQAHSRRGGGYVRIYEHGDERLRVVKTALLNGFTVAFGTKIGSTFLGAGTSWIHPPLPRVEIVGGHAMLIVGWHGNQGGEWFRVLNSWGADWRDGGLCWMHADYLTWAFTHDLHIIHGWERTRGSK